MVENLIAGYLAGGKRLVIPELGAFLKKETGETVFVEFLKKDDGVFTGLIAGSLGIPAVDAAKMASRFSAEIRESLAGRGFFIIPNVGTMRRDSAGNIIITASEAAEATRTTHPALPHNPRTEAPRTPEVTVQSYERPAVHAAPIPTPVARPQVKTAGDASRVGTPQISPSAQPETEVRQADRPVRGERIQRPGLNMPQGKKKTDMIMIIAVIAALIAIGSMVFGLMVNSDPIGNIQPTSPQSIQLPVVPEGEAVTEPAQ